MTYGIQMGEHDTPHPNDRAQASTARRQRRALQVAKRLEWWVKEYNSVGSGGAELAAEALRAARLIRRLVK